MIIYKTPIKVVVAFATTALILSCQNSSQEQHSNNSLRHMDIPAYFNAEISRLTEENPVVIKTVKKDDSEETKELKIGNWANELSSYLSIDLNKPAYMGLLKKDSTDNKVTFTISNPNIDISLVEIGYEQGKPVAFTIKRTVKNSLYQTEETLNYKRDESYSLDKTQSVVALDDNHYYIEGRFKQ